MSTPIFTVFPMRFSTDPAAVIAFWETLGLTRVLDHTDGSYAEFAAASGRLAVHPVGNAEAAYAPGDTTLNFAVADVRAAVADLQASGLTGTAWDETYGEQGSVTAPDGRTVGLNELEQTDLYGGYRVHEQTVAASLDVVAVWPSDDFARDSSFFAPFGFEPFDPPQVSSPHEDRGWRELRTGRRVGGVVGLHAPHDDFGRVPATATGDRPGLVRIAFETSEPLDALAGRLRAAGHPSAEVIETAAGTQVRVVDPDGRRLEIHPTV